MTVYAIVEIRLSYETDYLYKVQTQIRRYDNTISEPPASSFCYDQALQEELLALQDFPEYALNIGSCRLSVPHWEAK